MFHMLLMLHLVFLSNFIALPLANLKNGTIDVLHVFLPSLGFGCYTSSEWLMA